MDARIAPVPACPDYIYCRHRYLELVSVFGIFVGIFFMSVRYSLSVFWNTSVFGIDIGISVILVENRKVLVPHLYLAPLLRMIPSEFRGDVGTHKTKMNGLSCGYRVVKKAWQYVQPFRYINVTNIGTDGHRTTAKNAKKPSRHRQVLPSGECTVDCMIDLVCSRRDQCDRPTLTEVKNVVQAIWADLPQGLTAPIFHLA